MGTKSMLDQAIRFADEIPSDVVIIEVNKKDNLVRVYCPGALGVVFSLSSLKQSNGGILNDNTAQSVLEEQLSKQEPVKRVRAKNTRG